MANTNRPHLIRPRAETGVATTAAAAPAHGGCVDGVRAAMTSLYLVQESEIRDLRHLRDKLSELVGGAALSGSGAECADATASDMGLTQVITALQSQRDQRGDLLKQIYDLVVGEPIKATRG